MSTPIRRVGVVGAGVMGAGIAAHLANASVDVVLLDIVPPNLSDAEKKDPRARNRFAEGGLDKATKSKPASFFHKSRAALVRTGNLDDDFALLAGCDLVIEAVVERLDVKRALFERLEKTLGPDAVIASNTSGLRIKDMLEGRSASFKQRFLVMHFFNPVRYMKLLELVAGPETSTQVRARVEHFGRETLGKGIVWAKDTPNFVGNRIGTHAMLWGIQQMLADGLAPEDLDAITGEPMAHPKSASFRTADLVGLDTVVHVADNCHQALTQDPEREVFQLPEYIREMVKAGLLGNKSKAGFYKKTGDDVQTFDPYEKAYRSRGGNKEIRAKCKEIAGEEDARARVKKLYDDQGPAGAFAWKLTRRALLYAAKMIGEITDDVTAIDDAMRWGYAWELGPFETWDAIGFLAALDRMEKDGLTIPECVKKMKATGATAFYRGDQVFDLGKGAYVARQSDPKAAPIALLRKGEKPVLSTSSAEAWDVGDGVLSITYRSKANSLDPDVIAMLHQAADRAERDFRALIIANEGEHFSVGANLFGVVVAAQQQQWAELEKMVNALQQGVQRLKYAKVPVVAAPFGMAVGGGLEVCLAADAVQAAAETYAGLVEVGVGLIPAGGGCLNLTWRALEGIPEGADVIVQSLIAQVFKNIATANVATSALMAQELGYFRKTDGISFDKARLAGDAKARAIGLAEAGYHPPAPRSYVLPGESGIATISMLVDTMVAGGFATEYDGVIARKLARILCGGPSGSAGPVPEQRILDLERETFLSLCGEQRTLDRMQHMLMHNRPLRN
ncbi:MAG: 3-hydroxyacyl-CoA dehydrogenase/enoyl-CoA hydratase family protein [Polyangiaceae bacterium]|nr:3-hydroxyacyl-CoA dehydrogenase/enoyl-CoA hydratase family protein [Polyangiaceae bacterium]